MRLFFVAILILAAMGPGSANAGTVSFNDLDLARNELQIYYINGSGTVLNQTIMSNQTASINSTNDYVVVIRPRALDMLASPEAYNPYVRIVLGMVAIGAVVLAFTSLFMRVLKGKAS